MPKPSPQGCASRRLHGRRGRTARAPGKRVRRRLPGRKGNDAPVWRKRVRERGMQRLKSGDEVIVMAGSHRGERGVVRKLVGKDRVLIENVNLVRKHRKPNPQSNQPGGIVEEERPLHASSVALFNPATEKGGRIGIKTLAEGQRVRFFKSDGEVIDTA